jgi:outer membrane receptor protein involved in Fe transport
MRFRKLGFSLILSVLLIILVTAISALAGTVGKIAGTIIDSETGVPIPGVSVRIDGSSMGAAASPEGNYVILNIPPGTYTLIASTVGYNKYTAKGVEVQADVTVEQNFKLVSSAVQATDIVVTVPKKAIDKYLSSNELKVNSDQMSTMPVNNIGDVIRTTPGFVREGGLMHARGGRAGEISYIVDGVEVRDVLGGYGAAAKQDVNISATDVAELSVLKGNFDAEYGGVNSAIINVVGKGGDVRTTTGRIEFLTDDMGFNKLNKYSFNSDRLEWNLSGPVPALSDKLLPALGLKWPGERMAYFVSFSVDKSNNYLDYNNYSSDNSKINYGYEKFLGIKIPDRRSNEYSASAKLTWKMDANAKYKLSANYRKLWQKYTGFSWAFLYSPSTAPQISESKEIIGASFTFSPNFLKNTYGELKVNSYIQKYEQRPGSRTPGDFLNSNNYESYDDVNKNGKWDAAEPFIDINGDGFFGEPFIDINHNGIYEPQLGDDFPADSVIYVGPDSIPHHVFDLNGNGVYDADIGEPYSDLNGNGKWDAAEPIANDHYFFDYNHNGIFDHAGDPFTDSNNNGKWDQGEHYEDINHNGQYDPGDFAYLVNDRGNGTYDPQLGDVVNIDYAEPYTDGDVSLGEPYVDVDLNGHFNGPPNDPSGPDIFLGSWDLNHNGRHDSPSDTWSPGIPFRDLNNNGRYDAPNGRYDYGEPFVDQNGNGVWDTKDSFWDYGFDQWALYHKTKTTTNTFSLNLTSQVSKQHEIKSGIEFKDMILEMGEIQYPDQTYDGTYDGGAWPDRGIFRDFYTRRPKQGSFYLRDKMEYGEMIADLGFRYEFYLQANEVKGLIYAAENYQGTNIYDTRNKFSPRISFSFPVSDKAKLYFNYGHFYQLPDLNYFYRRPTQASSAAGIIGNPNLDFQKTIQYELGVQYSLSHGYVLDVSGFYKDYYGLLNSIRQVYGPISTDVYGNIDYARSRGLEFQLEKRYGSFYAGSIDYQYSWAFGKNSSESADYFARFYRQEIPIQERPLDWDIRHQITLNGDVRAQKNQHPKFGVITLPDDWSLNVIWQFKTGKPFTPDSRYPGLILVGKQTPLPNSQRMPYYSTVDIRLDKNFQVWKINYTATLRVFNLFDTKNVIDVYSTTGLAYSNQNNNGQILTGLPTDANPANYDSGRQVQIGMSLNF